MLAYQIGYLSNLIPVPGTIGVLDGSLVGMLVLYGAGDARHRGHRRLPRDRIVDPGHGGTVAFLILRRTRDRPIELRPSRAERRQLRKERQTGDA